jgi:hypothetical protein
MTTEQLDQLADELLHADICDTSAILSALPDLFVTTELLGVLTDAYTEMRLRNVPVAVLFYGCARSSTRMMTGFISSSS